MADERLREAFQWASRIVHNVKTDQLDDPTRCEGWTVRMLMTHMIGAAQAFAAGVPVGKVSPQVDVSIDLCGDDWGSTYDAAWPGVLDAWAVADPDASTDFPWGPTPNAIARQLLLMESAVHGSDLAKATGEDSRIPDDVAEATSELTAILYSDPANRAGEFAPAITVPYDASASDKAIAFLGRHP
ncbi:MAG TPA: TIGR03086 family metal-binding protein [Aeromicrobium sp.]|nr:TIGR03086 family metal-binding protein [Aeromicrobium sp.]